MDADPTPRRRQPASDRLARRKRVTIACQFCRVRKTRCDGVKPVCGFCQRHEARCVWGGVAEEANGDGLETTPAEREILSRLDEIKMLMRANVVPDPAPDHSSGSTTAASQAQPNNLPTTSPALPLYPAARCESLLQWPIFHGVIEPLDAAIHSFVLCAPAPSHSMSAPARTIIQEHSLLPLCRKFLARVHPRNPILEGSEPTHYAKHAAENGLGWDGRSCLVPSPISTEEHTEDIASAQAFYMAAKKRIGLLGCSLVDIQCLFFAHVYEKCALDPLQAWLHIQQASVRLQTHLKRQQWLSMLPKGSATHASEQNLVQRVFWSIFRAESELLMELPLKTTGIEDCVRTDSMFPTPPDFSIQSDVVHEFHRTELHSWQEERSWFFYLAETSLRRTINDMLWLLFRKGESYWLNHNKSLEKDHQHTQAQISVWYTHLPDSIRFDPAKLPDNEYAFYLQCRFCDWQSYALTPFLYYALHQPPGQELSQLTKSYAQKSLSVCATGIMYADRHHRHGGTWFACRRSFAYALCILAAVLKGDSDLSPPLEWQSLLSTSITTLKKWEAQPADIHGMVQTLERVYQAVCSRIADAG